MIHVIATIEIVDGGRDAFLRAFKEVVPKVLAEPGCLDYGPTVDFETNIPAQGPVRENVVTIVERWESIDALESHLMTPHMLAYRQAVKDLVVRTTLRVLEPA
jgi:quinol monooxygenase YgiN